MGVEDFFEIYLKRFTKEIYEEKELLIMLKQAYFAGFLNAIMVTESKISKGELYELRCESTVYLKENWK